MKVNTKYEKISRPIPALLFKGIDASEVKPHLSNSDIIFEKFRVMAEHLHFEKNEFDRGIELFFGASVNTSLSPYLQAMLMMTFSDHLRKNSHYQIIKLILVLVLPFTDVTKKKQCGLYTFITIKTPVSVQCMLRGLL